MTRLRLALAILLVLCVSSCTESADMASGDGGVAEAATSEVTLLNTAWRVEDIDQGGIIDRSMITIGFPEQGRLAGSAGCNQYFGNVSISGASIELSAAGTTQRACAPALMNQERRFLGALQAAVRHAIDDNTWLVLYDETGAERIRAIATLDDVATNAANENGALDAALAVEFSFDCGDAGSASVRFSGPETVELDFAAETYQLPRVRAASGARYRADDVGFWNQGDEAMIEVGSSRHTCTRID